MKKLSVRILVLVLVIATVTACALSFSACSNKKTIGIIQYVSHPSLDDCYHGILMGLTEELGEDLGGYKIDFQNSNGESSVSAAQANTMVSKNYPMIAAIATPSAVSASAAAQGTLPVVYCAVSDPSTATGCGLDDDINVTGSSDLLDFDGQLALIKAFIPDVDSIGVLYSKTEPNSISQLATLKSKAQELGITIVEQAITESKEIQSAAETLCAKDIDCITNLTDNAVVAALEFVLEAANAKNIPVFGSEIDQVKNGCLASASLDYVALGRQTGILMAKILKGEVVASNDSAIKVKDSFNCYSKKVADKFGLTVPESAGQNVDTQAAA